MSEKYEIKRMESQLFRVFKIQDNGLEHHFVDFRYLVDAEKYVAWKNLKIDEDVKKCLIGYLMKEISVCNKIIDLNNGRIWLNEHRCKIESCENAIEAIKLLEVE